MERFDYILAGIALEESFHPASTPRKDRSPKSKLPIALLLAFRYIVLVYFHHGLVGKRVRRSQNLPIDCVL